MSLKNTVTRVCVLAAGVTTAAALFAVAPASAAPQDCAYMGYGSAPDTLGLQFDTQEQAMFDAINAYRADNGLPALVPSDPLRRPAMWASLDDVTTRGFAPSDHIDSRAMDIPTRVQFCSGYTGLIYEINFYQTGGSYENSIQPAMDFWKGDPPHNAILLNSQVTTMAPQLAYNGVDAEILYAWTVDFGDH